MSQFDIELSFAKQVAYEAGKVMLHYFNANDKGVFIKADESPVTLADTEINKLVVERVKAIFPDHGVLGKKTVSTPTKKAFGWLIHSMARLRLRAESR